MRKLGRYALIKSDGMLNGKIKEKFIFDDASNCFNQNRRREIRNCKFSCWIFKRLQLSFQTAVKECKISRQVTNAICANVICANFVMTVFGNFLGRAIKAIRAIQIWFTAIANQISFQSKFRKTFDDWDFRRPFDFFLPSFLKFKPSRQSSSRKVYQKLDFFSKFSK